MGTVSQDLYQLWLETLRSVASGLGGSAAGNEQDLLFGISTMSRKCFIRNSCYIISGISGSGKTTLGWRLEGCGFQKVPNVVTRSRRPEERERDYVFVDEEEFRRLWRNEKLATVRRTNGVWHGFRWSDVKLITLRRKLLYMDKSVPSAKELAKLLPANAWTGVYLLPPSFRELVERIIQRESRRMEENARSLGVREIEQRFYEEIPELAQSLALPYTYFVNWSIEELIPELI